MYYDYFEGFEYYIEKDDDKFIFTFKLIKNIEL